MMMATGGGECQQEVRLLFFGTFFHENTELTSDLVQLKQPARVIEVRMIPLGATVDLSTGAFQLGATNPSEFDLEFYYNDLQDTSKSTFELLKVFGFNDKSHIHFMPDTTEEIITDGLLVRGMYSTVTLAVYGYVVDKVPQREKVVEKVVQPVLGTATSSEDNNAEHERLREESPDGRVSDSTLADVSLEEKDVEEEESLVVPPESHVSPITVSTKRLSFDTVGVDTAVQSSGESVSKMEERIEDPTATVVGKEKSRGDICDGRGTGHVDEVGAAAASTSVVEVMDTEEISDGEVFPSDEEEESPATQNPDLSKSREDASLEQSSVREEERMETDVFDTLVKEAEPISSPPQDVLSDVDDSHSLMDEFHEPGFEEIISDEEIDFPEYEFGEWEEHWANKFSRPFNPFSESFQVIPLKNIAAGYLRNTHGTEEECLHALHDKCKKWPRKAWSFSSSEVWVEDMERLLPSLSLALSTPGVSKEAQGLEDSLKFWVESGLNFELAMQQTALAFKSRHLKVGIKLIQCLANCDNSFCTSLVLHKFHFFGQEENEETHERSVPHHLLDLLMKPHMSTTNKLLIVRTLDSIISALKGFESFTSKSLPEQMSCYEKFLEYSTTSPGTRIMFSIRTLLRKLQLMEDLRGVKGLVNVSLSDETTNTKGVSVLRDLVEIAGHIDQYFCHPLRIMPAKSVVALPPISSSGHDPKISFVRMLKEMQFLQMSTVFITTKENDVFSNSLEHILDLLTTLLDWDEGLVYLSNEGSATTTLIKALLQQEDDAVNLGCLIAHCLEVLHCVDVLLDPKPVETDEDFTCLQTTFSFLTSSLGRQALVKTISKSNFVVPFLKCIRPKVGDKLFGVSVLEKTARRGYALEIMEHVIRSSDSLDFMEKYGPDIYNIMTDLTESPKSEDGTDKFCLLQPFMKPTLSTSLFTLDGIDTLCNLIKTKRTDLLQSTNGAIDNWGFPPELTTYFRMLSELTNSPEENDITKNLPHQTDELLIRQLKSDLVLVKIHANDLISTMISIVQRIVEDFDQPMLHAHVFVSAKGDALLSLLQPLIKTLRLSITQVIQARKTEFRDTTAIPWLLKIYNLLTYFPTNSFGHSKAQEICQNVVGTLLAYTIPALKFGQESEDELNKSTWSAVVSNIIKFTLEEPANFQTGLTLLSELLPLPLPIASRFHLDDATCLEAIKLRRLWSAYIHGLSTQLQEMIGILYISTNIRLLNLLKRVCVQLADLSASTCLVVCRALLDTYTASLESDTEGVTKTDLQDCSQHNSVKAWVDTSKPLEESQCSMHTARLLSFLASLLNNCAVVKCGIMHILKGTTKLDEKYCDLYNSWCAVLLAQPVTGLTNSHVQAQDSIVTIFQSLCDVEINMLIPMFGVRSKAFEVDFILANSLPQKEHLTLIAETLLNYLSCPVSLQKPTSFQVLEGVLRSLEIIAETEFGFQILTSSFEKRSAIFSSLISSLMATIDVDKNTDAIEAVMPCVISYLDLLKSLSTPRPHPVGSYPPRLSVLSHSIFCNAVKWPMIKEAQYCEKTNALYRLQQYFKEQLRLLTENRINFSTIDSSELEAVLGILEHIVAFCKQQKEAVEDGGKPEQKLCLSETLTELFNVRPAYVLVDRISGYSVPTFWQTSIPPAFELDADTEESELVPCDLEEVCKNYLNGFDVLKELKNMSKVASLQSNEAKTETETEKPTHQARPPLQSSLAHHMHSRRAHFTASMRGRGMFSRGMGSGRGFDPFRSRPPNTSRPPSLHVDDFVAMESSGQSGGSSQQRSSNDTFSPRGRQSGGRGSAIPYGQGQDMRRLAASRLGPSGGGNYYPVKRGDGTGPPRMVRGGRVFSTPNSDRWTADSRVGGSTPSSQPYERILRNPYDDKYNRSSISRPGSSSTSSSLRTHPSSAQPYSQQQRSSIYSRDQRSLPSSSAYSARWRSKPFNR